MKNRGNIRYAYYQWNPDEWERHRSKIPFNYFQSPEFCEAWDQFVLYRDLSKAPMSEYAGYTNLLTVHRIADGDIDKAIAAINQTIEIGKWTGIFEPKNYFKKYEADL